MARAHEVRRGAALFKAQPRFRSLARGGKHQHRRTAGTTGGGAMTLVVNCHSFKRFRPIRRYGRSIPLFSTGLARLLRRIRE